MRNAIGVHEIVLIGVINSCQWQIKCAGLQQSLFPCFVCELLPNKTAGRQDKWQGAREDKAVDFFHGDLFIYCGRNSFYCWRPDLNCAAIPPLPL
ncbi:MAG: hypothetical protein IPQ01_10690 [Zoogloea sp.]|nr:hypothetical protein [Zoogloea sp.]